MSFGTPVHYQHCHLRGWRFPIYTTQQFLPVFPAVAQVYLQLTLAALERPSQRAAQGGGVGIELDGMNHYDGVADNPDGRETVSSIVSSSPESLLSKSELYTDQALDSGSGLPLARLVKGQALALRGQHQVKLFCTRTSAVAPKTSKTPRPSFYDGTPPPFGMNVLVHGSPRVILQAQRSIFRQFRGT